MDLPSVAAVVARLRLLGKDSYGPCGEEVLVFAPPEAPVITADTHTLWRACRKQSEALHPVATVIFNAQAGLFHSAGDATTQLVLLLGAVVEEAMRVLHRHEYMRSGWTKAHVSRAFGRLKGVWARGEIVLPHQDLGARSVPTHVRNADTQRLQLSDEFMRIVGSVLRTAMTGMFSAAVVDVLVQLVMDWVFYNDDVIDRQSLGQRLELFLHRLEDAVVFVPSMSQQALAESRVLRTSEFILRKALVPSQMPSLLDPEDDTVIRFVCFGCTLLPFAGANEVVIEAYDHDALFRVADAQQIFLRKCIRQLRLTHHVRLLVSTEELGAQVVSLCTEFAIACVQLVEAQDLMDLCTLAGTYPLTSVFDIIVAEQHIGVAAEGVRFLRINQRNHLLFQGIHRQNNTTRSSKLHANNETAQYVPQLMVRAASKGVYTQYYSALRKCLRVMKSLTESTAQSSGLRDVDQLARSLLAQGLVHVLDEYSRCSLEIADHRPLGFVYDHNNTIDTLAGRVRMPAVVKADPTEHGVLHPWKRMDSLIYVALETLEQLFRIDAIIHTTRRVHDGDDVADESD
ncbi:TPA: hypothetical protein N0F65_008748 [Lagenidium giganteum]|uniref:Uncharacterized protein n=1 Tax=Lagenidium giganteum TaxID=4803 RepID=A0AAV2Z2F3_9STRA|nr:TPA: hypothetical protein N0F65_008748 [Lagenidium giganteum]